MSFTKLSFALPLIVFFSLEANLGLQPLNSNSISVSTQNQRSSTILPSTPIFTQNQQRLEINSLALIREESITFDVNNLETRFLKFQYEGKEKEGKAIYREAKQCYRKFFERYKKEPKTEDALQLSTLAYLLSYLESHTERSLKWADSCFNFAKQASKKKQEVSLKNQEPLAKAYFIRGRAYQRKALLGKDKLLAKKELKISKEDLISARDIKCELYGDQADELASINLLLGWTYYHLESYSDAIKRLTESRKQYKSLCDRRKSKVNSYAYVCSYLAQVYKKKNKMTLYRRSMAEAVAVVEELESQKRLYAISNTFLQLLIENIDHIITSNRRGVVAQQRAQLGLRLGQQLQPSFIAYFQLRLMKIYEKAITTEKEFLRIEQYAKEGLHLCDQLYKSMSKKHTLFYRALVTLYENHRKALLASQYAEKWVKMEKKLLNEKGLTIDLFDAYVALGVSYTYLDQQLPKNQHHNNNSNKNNKENRYKKAVQYLEEAWEVDKRLPKNKKPPLLERIRVRVNLGSCYLIKQQQEMALQLYLAAENLIPLHDFHNNLDIDDPDVENVIQKLYTYMSAIYQKKGDKKQEKQYKERLLNIKKSNKKHTDKKL